MIIGYGLHVRNSAEAVELYRKAFGLDLGYHVKNPDGSYFHSELYKDGKEVLSVVEDREGGSKNDILQLGVTLCDEAEVRKAYEVFESAGVAQVKSPLGPLPWSPCAVDFVDAYGVWWFITAPMHQPPEDYDPEKPWDPSMYRKPE